MDQVKYIKIALILLLLAGLSACGKEEAKAEIHPDETPSATETTPAQVTEEPPESSDPRNPEYLYLSEDELSQAGEDQLFRGWYYEEDGTRLAEVLDVTEESNVLALDCVSANGGDTLRIPLRLVGKVELCAVDLKIKYDPDHLKYAGCENADDDLLVNCNEEKGIIMVNFLRIVNLEENFTFCEFLFDVITTTECESTLEIEVVQAVAVNGGGELVFPNSAAANGIVYLNRKGG